MRILAGVLYVYGENVMIKGRTIPVEWSVRTIPAILMGFTPE